MQNNNRMTNSIDLRENGHIIKKSSPAAPAYLVTVHVSLSGGLSLQASCGSSVSLLYALLSLGRVSGTDAGGSLALSDGGGAFGNIRSRTVSERGRDMQSEREREGRAEVGRDGEWEWEGGRGGEATERPPTKHDSMCSVLAVSLGPPTRCLRRADSLARQGNSSCVKQRGGAGGGGTCWEQMYLLPHYSVTKKQCNSTNSKFSTTMSKPDGLRPPEKSQISLTFQIPLVARKQQKIGPLLHGEVL